MSETDHGTVHPTDQADFHQGRPILRKGPGGTPMILCPYGHLVTTIRKDEWAGSIWEAQISDPNHRVTCYGKLHRSPHLQQRHQKSH